MLKTRLLHPEILSALAASGHFAKVLISDGNYPSSTKPNPRAKVVWANFTPGVLDACTVLKLLCELIPVEAAEVMAPAREGMYAMKNDPAIWQEFRAILANQCDFKAELTQLDKSAFNEQARKDDVSLVIATAETQIYANIMLTVGVVR